MPIERSISEHRTSSLECRHPGLELSANGHGRKWEYFLKRFLWSCVQLPFWPKTPRVLNPLRIMLLRLFGARIGRGCVVGSVRIWIPWNLQMDEFAVVANGAELYNLAPIRIGAHSVVSQEGCLCTSTHDYTQPDFPLYSRPITVGARAWIAARAFIAPGITVGEGAVVGACSVVTKNVSPWAVCVGNPCREIKQREPVAQVLTAPWGSRSRLFKSRPRGD